MKEENSQLKKDALLNIEELDRLEPPSMDVGSLLKHFGPGLILMMTGIGTSHLVTAPTAGGRFAYALLWTIPFCYLFKYYGFEMAFRFTNATGKSMMDAYGTAPGKWPLWYTMVITLVQCAVGSAGRTIAAAAVMYYLFTVHMGLPLPLWSYGVAIAIFSCYLILYGNYAAVEKVTKICAGALVFSAIFAYVYAPAPMDKLQYFFIFDMPKGSWLIVAGFFGLLPTGIDVSLQASEWGKAKKKGLGYVRTVLEEKGRIAKFDAFKSNKKDLAFNMNILPAKTQEYCRRWFRIGTWDFAFGHWISAVVAAIYLLLAAVWIYPSEVKGTAVMGEIGKIFTESIGDWMMWVFILGAFAACFSTAFNYYDGWPRVVGACCRNIFKGTNALQGIDRDDLTPEKRKTWYSEYNIYRMTMMWSLVMSSAIIIGLPKPVYLVLVASALAYFIAPVIFFLNLWYCFTVIDKNDKHFYPSTFATWFGWISCIVFALMTGVMIAARVFNIKLFG
ncbi:MAG: Nramp family divalent metal transporter [Deltaproteobacteria bacterium]|nr:Nramp family divalent metal transporter [Deltaproteobacteria bacterium]